MTFKRSSCSYRQVVARVLSEDMIELNVIYFVSCLGHESFVDDTELLLGTGQLHVIKDRSEPRHADEATSLPILVLEVGLDEDSAVLHISS